MKRLKPELRTDPRYVSAMRKEFETGYRLEHPHLVRYVSCGDDYILMDYVDGTTLSDFVRLHPEYFCSRRSANRFLCQLLSVVGYLHQHQIVHLDLKPANILITRIGHNVKLVDLGYCYTDVYTDTIGRTDMYAAPEQFDVSSQVDERTDIYAIGRLLEQLPCARIYNKVIARCTKGEKKLRYQTADDMLRDICGMKRWRKLVILTVVVLAMVLTGLWWKWHPADSVTYQSEVASIEDYAPETVTPSVVLGDEMPQPRIINSGEDGRKTHSESMEQPEEFCDSQALHRELMACIGPLYEQAMGNYNDSSFNRINEQCFFRQEGEFEESILPLYTELWEKYEGTVDKYTMEREWTGVINYYLRSQIERMQANQ